MSNRKYYCFCDANCRFETMTKEQILAAIASAAEGGLAMDPDAAFVTQIKDQNLGKATKIWRGTQAQYNALVAKNQLDADCLYFLTDKDMYAGGAEGVAEHVADTNNPHGVTAAQVGATTMKLLWENASPASSFAAQTVSVDWGSYDIIGIECRATSTTTDRYISFHPAQLGIVSNNSIVSGTSTSVFGRKSELTESGIEFFVGKKDKADGTTYSIPTAIYGIKGVLA